MRTRAAAAVAGLAFAIAPVMPAAAAPDAVTAEDCKREPGVATPTSTWALERLQLAKVAPITRGRDVRTGQPVTVAVIDSGLDRTHPQLRGIDAATQRDAISGDPGAGIADCVGHGTRVTAILAAQPSTSQPGFTGVAPDARILPIKITNKTEVAAADVARAIDIAVDAGAKIANVSVALGGDDPAVRAAVGRAQRAGMLIVAAAGNDGNNQNKLARYPAAYATSFDNVLGVAAMTQANGIAQFSDTGDYVGVAAPGDAVQSIGVNGGYFVVSGTSFATPYVAGTAALVLAANPGLSAKALRDRIQATADAPPASIPDTRWGYGVLDPYLAVTSVRVDAPAAAPSASRRPPVAAASATAATDHTARDVALALGLGLLALTAAVAALAAVVRGRPRTRRTVDETVDDAVRAH